MTKDDWLYAVRRAGKLEDYPSSEDFIAAVCAEMGVQVPFGNQTPPREPGSDDECAS